MTQFPYVYERSKRGNTLRRQIAQDTIAYTKEGLYGLDGRDVALPRRQGRGFSEAEIINEDTAGERRGRSFDAQYILAPLDSFEAAGKMAEDTERTAVHNFACASHAGGGFLKGSRAQEESLCRESTLFESISSPTAAPFYSMNKASIGKFYPVSMIFSPSVAVFRDADLNLLPEPFALSVFTLAAPNLKGRASGASKAELYGHMKRQLTTMFRAASSRDIATLVLGAWGCGAFGHNPYEVAGLTRRALEEDGWESEFRQIIFAVKPTRDPVNLQAFAQVFRDRLEDTARRS